MGLSFRKRTKGANGWVNISASKKNGLGFSLSGKIAKGITVNWKPGRGFRTTVSAPGTGIRWVSSSAKAKIPRSKSRYEYGDNTTSAQQRNADAAWAAREARHDEIVAMHEEIVKRIATIDNDCTNAVNSYYKQNECTEDKRLDLVSLVDSFEGERAALVAEDNALEEQLLAECDWQAPITWRDNNLQRVFDDLCSKISLADLQIDWYREQQWSDDEIMRLRVRRLGYVTALKEHVEANAVHAVYEPFKPSVVRIFAPTLSVMLVAVLYALYRNYVQ